ncbi:MAG: MSMEG_4193 family putative phosphomutase [Nocardioidaceae bacterium]
MATLILARHGRTSANTEGVLAGRSKGVHLDELGRGQADAAAVRLAEVPLAAVVSSPLERCRETAGAIVRAQAKPGGHPVRLHNDRGLVECDYGEWTGQPLKTLAKEPLWRTVQVHPAGAAFPGGESMAAVAARALAAVRRWNALLDKEHGADAVWVAVSHGDVIKAILADALGMHLDSFQRIVVDPASLSVVRYTQNRPFVLTTNSSGGSLAHLRRPKQKRSRRRTGDAEVGGGAGPATA